MAGNLDARTSEISDVDERAGGRVMFHGVDGVHGRLRISGQQGDEALYLGLCVLDEADAYIEIRSLDRCAQRGAKKGKKR